MDLEVAAHKVVDGTDSRNLRTHSVPNYPTSPPYGTHAITVGRIRSLATMALLSSCTHNYIFLIICRTLLINLTHCRYDSGMCTQPSLLDVQYSPAC